MKGFLDVQHPMFQPVWLRGVIVAVSLGWAAFEAIGGNGFWAILFGAAGVYLAYQFFVVWNPKSKEDSE
jgi:hypothetical protein